MSKTSVENLMGVARAYWKRFAESATDWLNKYRTDPFFRTEINVVSLLSAFSLIILGLVGTSFSLLYHDISTAIVEGIRAGIASNSSDTMGPAIVGHIQAIRTQNMLIIISTIVLITIVFGYIIARVTLAPARHALIAQKQFIGNIAHELRTPLAVIKTNTEVSLLGGESAAEMKKTLQSNVEELDRISEIINNLLSLSALVRPERMEFTAVDLSAVAADAVQKFSQFAKQGELQVTVRKSPEAQVWGNTTALTQIVSNLVKNAMNYTPKGGHVTVTIAPAPEHNVELTVQDSGIGIARKDLFRIFEPFYRADLSRTRGRGGSGLGLAIVNELVKMHQGKIMIRSAVGRGTSVIVILPAARKNVSVGGREMQEGLNEIAVDFSGRSH